MNYNINKYRKNHTPPKYDLGNSVFSIGKNCDLSPLMYLYMYYYWVLKTIGISLPMNIFMGFQCIFWMEVQR